MLILIQIVNFIFAIKSQKLKIWSVNKFNVEGKLQYLHKYSFKNQFLPHEKNVKNNMLKENFNFINCNELSFWFFSVINTSLIM